MSKWIKKIKSAVVAPLIVSGFLLPGAAFASFDAGIPFGWSCTGNCGTLGADGVVTTSPEGGSYGWVSSTSGVTGTGLGLGSETNGSVLRSTAFSANAGDDLEFYFNFVTSDGAGYADYGWARLLDSSLNEIALLFTARTTPSGNSVPGFGMPGITATINPGTVTIIPGGPDWSVLGGSSGTCYDTGCGYSDWVESLYTIGSAGNYILEFGVVNWQDTEYDTGLAFDGITIGGNPIPPVPVPEPFTAALLGLGLAGIGAMRRRRKV